MINQDQTRPDVLHNRVYDHNVVKERWSEFKGGVRRLWGDLSENDLEETKGEMASIAELIQRKYGESKNSVEQKLDNIFREFYDEEAETFASGDEAYRDEQISEEEYDNYEREKEEALDAGYRNPRERQL